MDYTIKPEEHELREARQTVEKTLESCRYVIEKEEDFEVSLSYADPEESGEFGVFGSVKTSESARIFFNPQTNDWKNNLEDLVADLYGQAWFYENSEVNFEWQETLASITGLMVIEQRSNEKEVKKDVQKEWAEMKPVLSKEISPENEELSWQLKTLIGRELLKENSIEEFQELKRSQVLDAGDAIFE